MAQAPRVGVGGRRSYHGVGVMLAVDPVETAGHTPGASDLEEVRGGRLLRHVSRPMTRIAKWPNGPVTGMVFTDTRKDQKRALLLTEKDWGPASEETQGPNMAEHGEERDWGCVSGSRRWDRVQTGLMSFYSAVSVAASGSPSFLFLKAKVGRGITF